MFAAIFEDDRVETRQVRGTDTLYGLAAASPGFAPSVRPRDRSNGQSVIELRVLIADDHEAVRRGLRSALVGAGWQVCGEAVNGQEAIDKVKELLPDVVILDVSMPIMGGLEAAPQILKSTPATKIVAFTMHESQQIRAEMARIGVHGIAVKSAPLSNLLATIMSVSER